MKDEPLETAGLWQAAALLFAMTFPTLATWLYFVVIAGSESVQPVFAGTKVLQFAFPVVWVMAVQKRRLRLAKPDSRGLLAGLAFGLAVLAAMMTLYYGFLRPSGTDPQGLLKDAPEAIGAKLHDMGVATVPAFIALATFYTLIHSLLEEYYWRWFVFGQLRRSLPVIAAVVVSSLGFMAHHVIVVGLYIDNPLAVAFFSLSVAVGGGVWAFLYHYTGSLYGAWLSHLCVDAGLMWMGYDMVWGLQG